MRDSLFRAAQRGAYFPSEEPVGQHQDPQLTDRCYEESRVPLGTGRRVSRADPALIVWPYPQGTADCIDRAVCADAFVRAYRAYRVVTELGLGEAALASLEDNREHLLVFAPFEGLRSGLAVDHGGCVSFRGRRCDAIVSELIVGYLQRYGLLAIDPHMLSSATGWGARGPLQTDVVNGSTYAAFKGLQMAHFARYCAGKRRLSALPFAVAADEGELLTALEHHLDASRAVVIRPFSGSQGTGIGFVDAEHRNGTTPSELGRQALEQISGAMERKYGGRSPFPLTVSPFEESVAIDGCVTDLRIFVVYDDGSAGLRALPGMVRRAQVPLARRRAIDGDCGLTNLNAPKAPDGVEGPRIFPLTSPEVLERLGLAPDDLVGLCRHACVMWATAFSEERFFFAGHTERQFCYGSVDFLVRKSDGAAIPVEMNGANVGSHPTVHPDFSDAFGRAAAAALRNLGLGR